MINKNIRDDDIALYRKYRPTIFSEVLGQDHVISVLSNSVTTGKISHAYLFSGSRGTGKTSVARIFASEIGCVSSDLYEIDAASNRGIDDIRELREGVRTLPFESKFKVYIIDEVHMLTKEAFNALLKTLEEPPKHAVFILATTELSKLPDTIISRCQSYTFKKPSQAVLKKLIEIISEKEGLSIESASADLVAFLGDGSFRDAQGILQKVISASNNNKITYNEVLNVTGSPKNIITNDFITALGNKDATEGLKILRVLSAENIDMNIFIKIVLRKVRIIMLMRYASEMEKELKEEFTDEDFMYLKKMRGKEGAGITSKTLLELLNAHSLMRFSIIPELPLEMLFLELDT